MAGQDQDKDTHPGHSRPRHSRRGHGDLHEHGEMSGFIVRPYDLVVGGLLMRGTYAAIAGMVGGLVPTGGTVVDVGTGPGRLPVLLARRRSDLTVVGVDPSADMLERARRRSSGLSTVRFIETGAESLPLTDSSVDAVISSLSSHHWADRSA